MASHVASCLLFGVLSEGKNEKDGNDREGEGGRCDLRVGESDCFEDFFVVGVKSSFIVVVAVAAVVVDVAADVAVAATTDDATAAASAESVSVAFSISLSSFCFPFLFLFAEPFPMPPDSIFDENGLSCIAAIYPLRLNSDATYLVNSVSLNFRSAAKEVDDCGTEADAEEDESAILSEDGMLRFSLLSLFLSIMVDFAVNVRRCFLVGFSPPDFDVVLFVAVVTGSRFISTVVGGIIVGIATAV